MYSRVEDTGLPTIYTLGSYVAGMHTSLSLLHRSGLSTHHVTYSKVCIPDSTRLKTFDTIVAVKLSMQEQGGLLSCHKVTVFSHL